MIDFYILGAGISGSIISNLLNKNYTVEVIDKAKGIGGRSSNKKINRRISFDHGLQYYSPKTFGFKKYLNYLINKKILKRWTGNHLDFSFKNQNNDKIIGLKGNNDLNKFLLKDIRKNLSQEIRNIKFINNHWEIHGENSKFKSKCVIITFPFPQAKKIAKRFLTKSFNKLNVKMLPNITLLLKQKYNGNLPISSFKFNNKIVSWASNENSKNRFRQRDIYWTVQTSENFSKQNINIYKKKKKYISNKILREFAKLLNLNYKNFKVIKIHGWKYSYNKNSLVKNCYWDKKLNLGLCGDWFVGPKAESAWVSANSLFQKIKKNPPKIIKRV